MTTCFLVLRTVARITMLTLLNETAQRITNALLIYALLIILLPIGHCSKETDLPRNIDATLIGNEKGALHIVSSYQCNGGYFTFQAWAQKYSLEMVNQPGKYTRLISCDHPKNVYLEELSYMDTMIVPDWGIHPTTGDDYACYNRPVALMYWLAERKPTAEWTLILDPDMLVRQPFLLENFQVPEGYAVAAHYSYLNGVQNKLAETHIPQITPIYDEFGGPRGRRADMVGAYYLIRTKDLARVAPLFLKYTEDIRADPMTMIYTGSGSEKFGQKDWVSDMYGYSFAAAVSGVRHKMMLTGMHSPDYDVADIPMVIHYCYSYNIGADYEFEKRKHMGFNALRCPPWDMDFNRSKEDDGGLFPHPPFPDVIPDLPPRAKYGQLLKIYVPNTINQALCARHRKLCAPSVQLEKECGRVDAIAKALKVEFDKLHVPGVICHDDHDACKQWAERGDCETNYQFMMVQCRASCKFCRNYVPTRDEITAYNAIRYQKIEDLKRHTKMLVNENPSPSEVSRCQNLSLKAFMVDSSCVKLVRDGIILLDKAQIDHVSFEKSTMLLRGSAPIGVYSAVMLAVGFVGLMLLFIRYSILYRKKILVRYK